MTADKVVPIRPYVQSDHSGEANSGDDLTSFDKRGKPPEPPDMDNGWRNRIEERLGALERGFSELKATIDTLRESVGGLKFALQGTWTFMAIGFAAVFSVSWFTLSAVNAMRTETLTAVNSLRTEMAAEARTTRAEIHADTSAQISAIANAITATKQQAPQVLLVPAPSLEKGKQP